MNDDDQSINVTIEKALALGDAPSSEAEEGPRPEKEATRHEQPENEEQGQDEHQVFLEMGKRLGYTLDKGDVKRVTSGERKAFQQKLAKFNEEYQGGVADLEQRASALAERYSRFSTAEKALEMGDMDAVAKTLGYEDWNDLNVTYLKKKTSPHHQELEAIKQKLAERERQEAERAAREEKERADKEYAESEREYREELTNTFSQNDEFSAWAEDGDFIGAVVAFQREHYHDGETISAEEAGKMALDGAWEMYKKLHSRFGNETPGNGASAAKPPRGASAKKVISQRDARSASGVKPTSSMSEDEWFDHHAKLLRAANR